MWVRLKDDAIDSEINEETVDLDIYQTQIQNIMSAFPGARFLQRKIGPFQDPSVGEKEDDVVYRSSFHIDHYHAGRDKKNYHAGTSTWLRVSLPQSLEKFKSSG